MHRARQATLFAILLTGSLVAAQRQSEPVEWLYYGGDQGGTKYSPLTDINAGERAAAAGGLAMEALGHAARRPAFSRARR